MRKGFELIELVFIIVILGILFAVAIPKLINERAKGTEFEKPISSFVKTVQDVKNKINNSNDLDTNTALDLNENKVIDELKLNVTILTAKNRKLKLENETLLNNQCIDLVENEMEVLSNSGTGTGTGY